MALIGTGGSIASTGRGSLDLFDSRGRSTMSPAPCPAEMAALAAARRRGVLVVQCGRSAGRVLARTEQRELGIVTGDDLTSPKARVLAMLALTLTDDSARVQAFFDEY